MGAYDGLVSGASTASTGDDDDRRKAERDHLRAMDEHTSGRDRLWNADGVRCDPHPHDAPPSPPVLPPSKADREDDPTGRHRYQANLSPMIVVTARCSAPECPAFTILPTREDTHNRILEAGGYRCADHPRPHKAASQVEGGPPPRPAAVMAEADDDATSTDQPDTGTTAVAPQAGRSHRNRSHRP